MSSAVVAAEPQLREPELAFAPRSMTRRLRAPSPRRWPRSPPLLDSPPPAAPGAAAALLQEAERQADALEASATASELLTWRAVGATQRELERRTGWLHRPNPDTLSDYARRNQLLMLSREALVLAFAHALARLPPGAAR